MPTTATSGWVPTNNLTGTSWSINTPACSAGGRILLFVAAASAFGATTPTTLAWTQHANYYNSSQLTTLVVYSQAFPGGVGAGSVTLGWSGGGAQGSAFAIALTDAQFDAISAAMVDPVATTTSRTLDAMSATTNGSLRFEFLVTAFYRTLTNGPLTDATQATYVSIPTGGIGAGVGYKAVNAGSTTGDAWAYDDPDNPAADSPSVGLVLIMKPSAPVNPVISGYAFLPSAGTVTGSVTRPASPSTPPAAVIVGPGAVNVTIPPGYDSTADKLHITAALVTDGVTGSWVTLKVVNVAGLVQPILVDQLDLGATYRFAYYVSRDGLYSEFGSFPTIPITIPTTGLSISPSSMVLDLAIGRKPFVVKVDGLNKPGVPVSSSDMSIATLSGTLSGAGGVVFVTPVAVGSAFVNIGPFAEDPARQLPVTVVDTASHAQPGLVITPAGPLTLDIQFGGKTFLVTYNGKPVVGAYVSIASNSIVDLIDIRTDRNGRFRVEPVAIGSAVVTVTLVPPGANDSLSMLGEDVFINGEPIILAIGEVDDGITFNGEQITIDGDQMLVSLEAIASINKSVTIDVINSTPIVGHATTIRVMPLPTIHLGDAPFNILVKDQALSPITSIEGEVSSPGYLSMAKHSKTGVFKVYPRGVGRGKLIFIHHDPVYGRLEVQRRFEVLP